jgi:hypothetical protein
MYNRVTGSLHSGARRKRFDCWRAAPGVVAAGVVLGLTALSAQGALAISPSGSHFHGYGVIGINSTDLTGISERRYDEAIDIPGTVGCKSPYSALPVYQTEWLIDTAGDWLELGTDHQCEGHQYWYAGYGTAEGQWYSLWTAPVSTDTDHRFWIQGSVALNEKYFTYNIDSVGRASVFLDFSGEYDQTGLESYSAKATAPTYEIGSLESSADYDTSWFPWKKTRVLPPVKQPVCILLRSATEAVAGENVSCDEAAAVSGSSAHIRARAARFTTAATGASASACRRAAVTWKAQAVTHAYQSTAGAVRLWRETRLSQPRPVFAPLSRGAARAPVAVCYLSGAFTGIPSPPGRHTAYRELSVMVNELTGASALDAASRGSAWPYEPPPRSWPGR